jgi:photosystem II stability/assembly factor-like uncharacterized protein
MSGHRLYWTTDNGAHWVDISPRSEDVTDVLFLDTTRGWALLSSEVKDSSLISFSLASTNDAGKSWSFSPLKVPSEKPDELDGSGWLDFIDPMHGWVVLRARSSSALSWGLLLTTDDGGKSWKELPQVPIAGRPIFITAQNGWLSGNGGPGGVYTTKDGGRTWDDNEPPLEELPASLPTRPWYGDVWFTDSKHGFIPVRLSSATDAENARGSALVLYVTDNAGLTWTHNATLTDKSFAKTGAPLDHFGPSAFALDQSGAAVMIAATKNDREHPDRLALTFATRDGKMVSANSEDVLRGRSFAINLSFINSECGWAATSTGDLLSTTNGGATWKSINLPQPHSAVEAAASQRALSQAAVPLRRIPTATRSFAFSPKVEQASATHFTESLGFDEHNVASIAAMGTWFAASPFYDVGFYAGGSSYCGLTVKKKCVSRTDPGLNSTWILQAEGIGWGLLPIWLGPQAPCVNQSGLTTFTGATAQSQGKTEADSAAAAMAALGLAGTIVFYDMESYTPVSGDGCSAAVQTFLTSWVSEITADGFSTTAVYGNPRAAQQDFSQVSGLNQVWITWLLSNSKPPNVTTWNLGTGSNALSDNLWPNGQRAHQFLLNAASVQFDGVGTGQAIDYDVEYFDVPGASGAKALDTVQFDNIDCAGAENTYPMSINSVSAGTYISSSGQYGTIVGIYEDGSTHLTHAYESTGNGCTIIDDPVALVTWARAINNPGEVVGYFEDSNAFYHGFTLTAGKYKTINYPGYANTYLTAINDAGQILGYAYQSNLGTQLFMYYGGAFYAINVPATFNGDAVLAGTYTSNGKETAFVENIAPPTWTGAIQNLPLSGYDTQVTGISNSFDITGAFLTPECSPGCGFLLPQNSDAYLSIEYPGANATVPLGINDFGQIVGYYPDPVTGYVHGFLATTQ